MTALMEQVEARLAPTLRWPSMATAGPGRVALLWVIATFLAVIDVVLFPGERGIAVTSVLHMSGTSVFAGLLAGWALRLRGSTLGLIAVFCTISIGSSCLWLAYEFWSSSLDYWWLFAGGSLGLAAALLWFGYRRRSKKRRAAAILLMLAANGADVIFMGTDLYFWQASRQVQAFTQPGSLAAEEEAETDPMAGIETDRLWEAQPALLAKAVSALRSPQDGHSNIYAITVAAQGSQQLFSREAQLALKVAEQRFGADYRGGVFLSNALNDLLKRPLATQGNVSGAAQGVRGRLDPARDVVFVYLASHGSEDAALATSLPNYDSIRTISAPSLAEALKQAGIKRRIIVVSACFSASWIPALANDDTIVITAAAKDRTSFGCDDSRRLTYFGEAFLDGPLARGASLEEAFETAKKKVARWEAQGKLEPSMPQAFVGRNMRALWTEVAQR